MHRLHPFLAIVAGILAAIGVALGLNALLVGIAVGTCVLFATGLRLPGQPEPPPVAAAVVPAPAPVEADVVPAEVRAFLDGLPGPLLVIGGDGKVSYVNAAAQEELPNARVGRHHAHLIRAPAFLEALAGADVLVIGVRRRSPVGKLVMGSVAQTILLDADCPVLAVRV